MLTGNGAQEEHDMRVTALPDSLHEIRYQARGITYTPFFR